jgi:hypothetical protein
MDVDELFLRTLDDLEQRTLTNDEYEILMSALLLRKLLLDGTPLIDRVNTIQRLKIRFPMNGESPYERAVHELKPTYWSLEDGIDPNVNQPPGLSAPISATRDQLLARRVMFVRGSWVTVRDLIDQLAHIEGAVHCSKPEDEREELLQEVARQVYVGGLPAGIRQVRSIGRVVLHGLAPLRRAVKGTATSA